MCVVAACHSFSASYASAHAHAVAVRMHTVCVALWQAGAGTRRQIWQNLANFRASRLVQAAIFPNLGCTAEIAFTGEVLSLGQSGASPANDARLAACPHDRSTGAGPSPWTPSPLKPVLGRFATSRQLLLLSGVHGLRTYAVPFGWMTPAPQYPVHRCAAVETDHINAFIVDQ